MFNKNIRLTYKERDFLEKNIFTDEKNLEREFLLQELIFRNNSP